MEQLKKILNYIRNFEPDDDWGRFQFIQDWIVYTLYFSIVVSLIQYNFPNFFPSLIHTIVGLLISLGIFFRLMELIGFLGLS